jgi:alpha-1,2-mannosyltransferase
VNPERNEMVTRYGVTMTRSPEERVPLGRIETPRLVYVVIAVCTVAAAFLRFYQLSRPGYLFGVTEYDDGVQFGDALRLVSGVIPYRDFTVVQPPGSFLVMAPVALLAKVTGSVWGLAIARLLTAAADTACVALLGLLVRHRGPVAAGIACGIYAVYPDALIASQTFMLEPWLNLFCLLGALAVFDGDRLTRGRGRLIWGGAAFGLAVTVKIWAAVPLAVAGLLLLVRWPRRFGLLVAGVVAGLAIPVLPFLILAPGGLIHDVIVSQLDRADVKHLPPLPRLSDMAGLSLFPHLSVHAAGLIVLAAGFVVALGYLAACWAGGRLPADLDWYALIGLVLVVGMLLFPYGYWSHYGAMAGPFIALVLALPAGLLRPAEHRAQIVPLLAISAAAAVLIAGVGMRQLSIETQLRTSTAYVATADRMIPSGTCVVSDYPSLLISADRFDTVAGCPAMVDSYGTLLAMTDGRKYADPTAVRALTAQWQRQFAAASYVWLEWNSQGRIPWTPALYAYFTSHFRLLGLIGGRGAANVPEPGLYGRRTVAPPLAARHRAA